MNDKSKRIKIMTEEKLPKALIKLSTPVIIGMVVSALYNVVDAMFVGRLGTIPMGAVSVAFPISMFIIGIGVTFASGASSYIARLLGKKDITKASKTASIALFDSVFSGIVVIGTILFFLDDVLSFFGATETILPMAHDFGVIFISASILNIINITLNYIVISEGSCAIGMVAMITGAVMNIILDPLFIYTFGMGVRGAAIATAIAQGSTIFIYYFYFRSGKSQLNISLKNVSLQKDIHREIIEVGIPLFLYQLLISVSIGLTNAAASTFGDAAVAAMGIVTRIFTSVTYVVFGYSKGVQPLVGYNFGASNFKRLKDSVKISLRWTTIFCSICSILMICFPDIIIGFFSNDSAVISIGRRALVASSLVFFSFGYQTIYISFFLGIGKAKEGCLLSLGRQGIFFIPLISILPSLIGLQGVIITQAIADLCTTLLAWILASKVNKYIQDLEGTHELDNLNGIYEKKAV